jgi:hypothetical protein
MSRLKETIMEPEFDSAVEETCTLTRRVKNNGVVVTLREEWRRMGLYHRLDGPAIVEIDPVTLLSIQEEWYVDGKCISPLLPPKENKKSPWAEWSQKIRRHFFSFQPR